MSLAFLSKKSWHVSNLKNVEKVWLAEQQAAQEDKRADELRKQIVEERQMNELRDLQEKAGLAPSREAARMDWMYEGPATAAREAESAEEYLLGKKYQGSGPSEQAQELKKLETAPGAAFVEPASLRDDSFSRLHEDPMLLIQQQRLKVRREAVAVAKARAGASSSSSRLLKKELKRELKKAKKEKKEKRRRRSRSRSRSRSPRRASRRSRSRSPPREARREARRRSRSRSPRRESRRSRSRSPPRREARREARRRSRSRSPPRASQDERDEGDRREGRAPAPVDERGAGAEDALLGGKRYGLQRTATYALDEKAKKQAATAIGPDAVMLAKREAYLKSKEAPKAPQRRRMTDEERRAAAAQMAADAQVVDASRARLVEERKQEREAEKAEEATRGSGPSFLATMGRDLHAGDGEEHSLEDRLSRGKFYAQKPRDQ